jgi:cutinase
MNTSSISNLAVQGVPYPADIAGFLAGGSSLGAITMAALINVTLDQCPKTLLTVAGYSQGAQLIHDSLPLLPSNITSLISSVVLFGDPKNGTAISNIDSKKVMTICHAGDDICKGGDFIGASHLNYSADAGTAAGFVMAGRGMGMLGISSGSVKKTAVDEIG